MSYWNNYFTSTKELKQLEIKNTNNWNYISAPLSLCTFLLQNVSINILKCMNFLYIRQVSVSSNISSNKTVCHKKIHPKKSTSTFTYKKLCCEYISKLQFQILPVRISFAISIAMVTRNIFQSINTWYFNMMINIRQRITKYYGKLIVKKKTQNILSYSYTKETTHIKPLSFAI